MNQHQAKPPPAPAPEKSHISTATISDATQTLASRGGELSTDHANIIAEADEHQLVITSVPTSPVPFPDEPFTTCVLPVGMKEKLYANPQFEFPKPMQPPPSPPVYRIGPTNGMLGMFATAHIKPGQLIVSERPLLVMTQRVSKDGETKISLISAAIQHMQPRERQAFVELYNCYPPTIPQLIGIANTNAYGAQLPGYDGDIACVCKDISRVNHSCSPNSHHHFEAASFSCQLRAIRHIKPGDEITCAYIDLYAPREMRHDVLRRLYSFDCACSTCSLPPAEQSLSDARRTFVGSLGMRPEDESDIMGWLADLGARDDLIIKKYRVILNMMEAERAHDKQAWPTCMENLCKAYRAIEDGEGAKEIAELAACMSVARFGHDNGWLKTAAAPEKTPWWGVRRIIRTGRSRVKR